jgi:hypothetical protein
MTTKPDGRDPLLRALGTLPRAQPDAAFAAEVHRQARLALAGDEPAPAPAASWWLRVFAPAVLAAVTAGYFSWSVLFLLAPLL